MASIGTLLKVEITRLAKREIRRELELIKKASAAHRHHIAALKREIAVLQRQVKAAAGRARAPAAAESNGEPSGTRFVAKGLKSLRARLGLSAAELGKLVGVSGQSVYNWENKKAVPRRAQVAKIVDLRSLSKSDARARLEKPTVATKAKKRGPAKKKVIAPPKRVAANSAARKRAAASRKRKARSAR